MVYVTSARAEQAAPVCEAAQDALKALAECGIKPRKPLQVRIVDRFPDHRYDNFLSFFDALGDKAVVADFDTTKARTSDAGWFDLPMSRALYRSLLVHELVHAVAHQAAGNVEIGRAGHEYLAYAIQLDTMEPSLRERILGRFPRRKTVTVRQLNESYLDFSSQRFAVKAYRHFTDAGNGCAFIRELVSGFRKLPSGQR